MFRKLLSALILILGLTSSTCASGQSEITFDKKIQGWLIKNNVPAAGVGIIEGGEIKYAKVIGELQKGIPAPDNAIFNVASITKTVVAMLTLKLVESGQWNLDKPLAKYWIDPDVVDDPLHKKLTTRHVLTHQTGFVNWRWNHPTKKLTFDFEPGTSFQYSGEGFEYLRRALENKFEKSLEQLSDSLLFKPLGMKDTRYCWDEQMDESRFAVWHDSEGDNTYNTFKRKNACAADDLLTTVEDYCKFGLFVINSAGLSENLFNDMISPHANIKEHGAMGLGWFMVTGLPNGEYALHHGGSDMGVKTIAILLPKSKRGIVVFTNSDNGMSVYNNVIKEAFDIGNDIYKYMYYRPNIPEIITVPDEILAQYTGRYRQPDGGENLISKKGNEISISGAGWPKITVYPEAENKFFVREFDIKLEFVKDEADRVVKMIIYQEGKKYSEAKKMK